MEDTIAAIATALGNGSISMVRLSGETAVETVNEIFRSKDLTGVPTHTLHYGHIYDGNEMIDEVMVTVMRAPKTYTREDVVEISCHGGVLVTKRILQTVLRHGARLAEPGEFTKRAFLNGRIDLSQAEAVMDLINAKNSLAVKNSLNQLDGVATREIGKMREELLEEIAFIEAALDDPEHYEMEDYGNTIRPKLTEVKKRIERMIHRARNGRILREGIRTAIVGLPNAGKSSLLNYLAKKERAIVTEIAGTTRDTIEEQIVLDDVMLNIVDTAGIRETEDVVERIGVQRSLEAMEDAQLVLYVVDASMPFDTDNEKILERLIGKKTILVLNKSDRKLSDETLVNRPESSEHIGAVVRTSLTEGTGLDELEDAVRKLIYVDGLEADDDMYVANERQTLLLEEADTALQRVLDSIDGGYAEDFLSIDLTEAYGALGKILGEEIEEDIIDKIFRDFCMGK